MRIGFAVAMIVRECSAGDLLSNNHTSRPGSTGLEKPIQPDLEAQAVLEEQRCISNGGTVLRRGFIGMSIAARADQRGQAHMFSANAADPVSENAVGCDDRNLAVCWVIRSRAATSRRVLRCGIGRPGILTR